MLSFRCWLGNTERSLCGNRENRFGLASLICFWTANLLLQIWADRFKFPVKVVPGIVFQIPGPNFIGHHGLLCSPVAVTNKRSNLHALNNKGLFLARAPCAACTDSGIPTPGLRLTEALPFGMSPDSHQNEENMKNCKVDLPYFSPRRD